MADKLTQLQDCLDDLLDQMYSSIAYIRLHHPYGTIPTQPSQAPPAPAPAAAPAQQPTLPNGTAPHSRSQPSQAPSTPAPDPAPTFNAALREISRDLIVKEQQIEVLIHSLPGIGSSEADQERRIRELEAELRELEAERAAAERVRVGLVRGLGRTVVGVGRVG